MDAQETKGFFETLAARSALVDLMAVRLAWEAGAMENYDWLEHLKSVDALAAAFPSLLADFQEGINAMEERIINEEDLRESRCS